MAFRNGIYVFIGLGVLIMALGADGDITMRPTNKAVLMGSARVNMSCTSSYGFQALSWGYIPVGGSPPSIPISFGGSTIAPNQSQYYTVEQSSGSEQNNLIILNATTSRAGTYICAEGASQTASAQLIVINSDPVCNMTPSAPTELLFNQAVQMTCSITYTANSYIGVDMTWSNGSFVSNAPPQNTTSANLTTSTSTITQTPGYSSPFPIYTCTTTFKITGNTSGSAANAPDYSKSTQLNSPINVNYLRPANASSITGAKDGDQVYLGTTVTCTVDGNLPPSYSWLDATFGNTTNTSTIQIWHTGAYQCTAWNTAGSTSVSINVTTYITTAAPTTATSTTPTTTVISRSTSPGGSGGGGGLSEGGKIGIGVGIGVGGTLVLVGILFIVLRRRNDWIKRTKTDDEIINKEEVSRRNNTNISVTPQYEQLKTLPLYPGPTYEQLTPSTDEQNLSDRTTYENIEKR